jgi:restriction endonuclease-like protein
MRLGGTLFEAKLTERDFTSRRTSHVLRYSQLRDCFDLDLLPPTPEPDTYGGYQLIRNVLAAARDHARLVILIDCRRPDLLQQWWKVHGAITSGELRSRCEVRTWQEVAAACDPSHRKDLEDKYGL